MEKEALFNQYLNEIKIILKKHQENPMSEYIEIDLDNADSEKVELLLHENFYDVFNDDDVDNTSDYYFVKNEINDFVNDHYTEIDDYCETNNCSLDDILDELKEFLEDEINQTDLAYNYYENVHILRGTFNFTANLITLTFSDIFNEEGFNMVDLDKDFFSLAKVTNLDLNEFKSTYFKNKLDSLEEFIDKELKVFHQYDLFSLMYGLADKLDFSFEEEDYQNETSYSILLKLFSDNFISYFDKMAIKYFPENTRKHCNNTSIDSEQFAHLLAKVNDDQLDLQFNITGSASDLLEYSKLNDSYSIPVEDLGIFSGIIYTQNYDETVEVNNLPMSKTIFSLENSYSFGQKNNNISHVVTYEEYEFLKDLHSCSYHGNDNLKQLIHSFSKVFNNKIYHLQYCKTMLAELIEKNTDNQIIEQYKTILSAIEVNEEKFSIIEQYGKKNITTALMGSLYRPNMSYLQNINADVLSHDDLNKLTQYFIQSHNKDSIFESANKNIIFYDNHTKTSFNDIFDSLKGTSFFHELGLNFLKVHCTKKNDIFKHCIESIILPNIDVEYTDKNGENILFACEQNMELVKKAISMGASINQTNKHGQTIFNKSYYLKPHQEELEKLYFETQLKLQPNKTKKLKI